MIVTTLDNKVNKIKLTQECANAKEKGENAAFRRPISGVTDVGKDRHHVPIENRYRVSENAELNRAVVA